MTRGLLPAAASAFLADQMQAIASVSTLHFGGALLVALWSARAGAATLVSAFNIAYRERETRGFLRHQAVVLAVTASVCLFGLLAFALVAVLPATVGVLPLSPGAGAAVTLARWPALAVLMAVALALLYRFGPCRSRPKWRWVSTGAVVATALWLAGSAGFSYYVAHASSYDRAFGVLGVVMLLLSWFYLTAFSVLLGAELNAEMERQTARDRRRGRSGRRVSVARGWPTPSGRAGDGPSRPPPCSRRGTSAAFGRVGLQPTRGDDAMTTSPERPAE